MNLKKYFTWNKSYDEVLEEVANEEALSKLSGLDVGENIIDSLAADMAKNANTYNFNPYESARMNFPNDPSGKGGYYFEDTNLSRRKFNYTTLSNLATHPLIAAIVQTRVNQCAEFASLADEDGLGFKVYLADPNNSPTDEEYEEIRELQAFLTHCGGPEQTDFEMSFEHFMRQIVRDSLIYDQCNFEIVRNKKGKIVSFQPVDAASIRRASLTEKELSKGRRDPDGIHYVQVIGNKVVAEYKQKDLCFGVRRPRSDMNVMGYGYPELEEVYDALQNVYNAEAYNTANFTNGISTSGIIAVKSKMNPKLFRAFRREFYQMLTGVNNAKRTPLIQLDPENDEQIQSVQLGSSNSEMEYQEWLHYLIKIICGVYQLDPSEIGFQFSVERVKNTLFTQDPFARVLLGREKGLRPLIRSIEVWINKYIVNEINPKYKFQFTGMDSISAIDKIKIEHHKMSYMTINEIRHYHDLPPLDDGDIIGVHYASLKSSVINREGLEVAEDFGASGGEKMGEGRDDVKPQKDDIKVEPAETSSGQDDNNTPDDPTSMGTSNDTSYLEHAKANSSEIKDELNKAYEETFINFDEDK